MSKDKKLIELFLELGQLTNAEIHIKHSIKAVNDEINKLKKELKDVPTG